MSTSNDKNVHRQPLARVFTLQKFGNLLPFIIELLIILLFSKYCKRLKIYIIFTYF